MIPERVRLILIDLLPQCKELTQDEMGWLASAMLRALVMKIGGEL